MIINAKSPLGARVRIYLQDGTLCDLAICEYNTETKEAKYYEMTVNEQGAMVIATTPWVGSPDGKMTRKPIIKTAILVGSYAMDRDGTKIP